MKLKAFEVNHGSYNERLKLFSCAITARDLVDESQIKVDRWKDSKRNTTDQGYQRDANKGRVKSVAKFVTGHGLDFPTTVLLSYRREGEKMPEYTYNKEKNELEITEYPVYLVDAQHRTAGIREVLEGLVARDPNMGGKELCAVLMVGLDKHEERKYFEIINTTAKGVSQDLGLELLAEGAKNDPEEMERIKAQNKAWAIKGVGIIHTLNELEDSPWNQRIKMPNEEYDKYSQAVAGSAQMVNSLKVVLVNGLLQVKSQEECVRIIDAFWKALRNLFPDALRYPKKHVIQKTTGMFTLHLLLNNLLLRMMTEGKELNEKNFQAVLRELFGRCGNVVVGFGTENENSKFWASGSDGAAVYRGQAGFKQLYNKLVEEGLDEVV